MTHFEEVLIHMFVLGASYKMTQNEVVLGSLYLMQVELKRGINPLNAELNPICHLLEL